MNRIFEAPLRLFAPILPKGAQDALVRSRCQDLAGQWFGQVTDQFLQMLLQSMATAFVFWKDYRRNIEGFRGTLTFVTRKGDVGVSAVFKDGKMKVLDQPSAAWDALVTYKDASAVWSMLLGGDAVILDSLLNNTVDADGTLPYIYRFGFLARDLQRRLGVA
jgi:hypothetical protein